MSFEHDGIVLKTLESTFCIYLLLCLAHVYSCLLIALLVMQPFHLHGGLQRVSLSNVGDQRCSFLARALARIFPLFVLCVRRDLFDAVGIWEGAL